MKRRGVLALACLVWSVAGCSSGREEFPAQIELAEDLAASSSGLLESCTAAAYGLSDRTTKAIETEGLGFFSHAVTARAGQRAWGEWVETPLTSEGRFPRAALSGCGEAMDHASAYRWERALQSPGSYYALTENREGMLVVVPRLKLAAFFYVG